MTRPRKCLSKKFLPPHIYPAKVSKESKNKNNPDLPVRKINFSLRESPDGYGSLVIRPVVGQRN